MANQMALSSIAAVELLCGVLAAMDVWAIECTQASHAFELIAAKIVQLIEAVGTHSITVRALGCIFRLMLHEDGNVSTAADLIFYFAMLSPRDLFRSR